METEDQENGSEVEESTTTEETKGGEDNLKSKDTEQSNEDGEKGTGSPKLFKVPDGRELTAEQVLEEYNKLLPEFTKRSQKLADYDRQSQEAKAKAETDARKQVGDNELLKDIDPSVKEAIVQIVKPLFEDYDKQKSEQATREKQDTAFEAELTSLEAKYDGKEGRLKFDRAEVLKALQETGNRDFDPESKFRKLHEKELNDALINQALKQKSGGSHLETTGSEDDRKPSEKQPRTWSDAAKRAFSRL